jgi:hypothetical protein
MGAARHVFLVLNNGATLKSHLPTWLVFPSPNNMISYREQCELLKATAELLRLPHLAIATSLTFLHRAQAGGGLTSELKASANVTCSHLSLRSLDNRKSLV